MDHSSTGTWSRSVPFVCLPHPLEVEPARLAYRRSQTWETMSEDDTRVIQDEEPLQQQGKRSSFRGFSFRRKSQREASPAAHPLLPTPPSSDDESLPPLPTAYLSIDKPLPPLPLQPKHSMASTRPASLPRRRSLHSARRQTSTHQYASPQKLSHEQLSRFESIPLDNLKDTIPAPLPRSKRSSLRALSRRLSLTPSEMPYPPSILTNPHASDNAAQLLGLRSDHPPTVPPKDDGYLPSHHTSPSPIIDPLNGRTAWLHALAAILAVANCWGLANAFGLFQAFYTSTLLPHAVPSTIAWIGSTQLALVFGLGVPVGRAVDAGFFHSCFRGGSVLLIAGVFATSWCKAFWSLWLAQGLLTGLGMGFVFCSGILALMSWFDEKKMGLAMGLGAAGSCVGGIAYVLLIRHFLVTVGFATTMRILGGVMAATMIPPNLVFRMRIHARTSPITHTHYAHLKTSARKIFLTPSYLLATAGFFLTFLGLYFGFVYLPSFALTTLHLSPTSASNLLIYTLAANLPGRFLPALISDACLGPLNTLIPSTFLSAAIVGLWIACSATPNLGILTVISCFYGFATAGVQVLYAPAVYSFCIGQPRHTTKSLEAGEDGLKAAAASGLDKIGLKAGVVFSAIGLACLIGTPIGGALISYRVDRGVDLPFLGAQIFAGGCLLAGGFLSLRVGLLGLGGRLGGRDGGEVLSSVWQRKKKLS